MSTRSSSASSARSGVGGDPHALGGAQRRQVGQRTAHQQQFMCDGFELQGGGQRPGRVEIAVRPDSCARRLLGEAGTGQRRTDAAPSGPRVHHQLGHRRVILGGRGQVQVADEVCAVGGQEMTGAVVAELAQHLIARPGRTPSAVGGRSDEGTNAGLLGF